MAMKFAANAKLVSQSIYVTLFWNLKHIPLSYVTGRYEKVLTSSLKKMSVNFVGFFTSDGKTQLVCKVQCINVTLTFDL